MCIDIFIRGGRLTPTNQRRHGPPKNLHRTATPLLFCTKKTIVKMVFTRSRPIMARYDVSSHMVKWWKGTRPTDGQVRSGGWRMKDGKTVKRCGSRRK